MRVCLHERSEQNDRYRVELNDGATVEAVVYRNDTVCVSSQVGCAVACPFCASGAKGFARHLSLTELTQQVTSLRLLHPALARVTLSGVGEPLHNPHSPEFLEWCRGEGLPLSLTTSGGPISRLTAWLHAPHRGLTISVHAGTEAGRAVAVPHAPSLDALFGCLSSELPKLSKRRRKKTALAYLLIAGLNDSALELDSFIQRASPLGLRVHLYDYNPVKNSHYEGVSRAQYEAVYARMTDAGLDAHMSSTARRETNGGCGTLVALGHPRLRRINA